MHCRDSTAGSFLYRRYFIRQWRRTLKAKNAAWPNRYDFRDMLRMSSLTDMASHFVRRYTNYRSLENYLNGYTLVGDTLQELAANTWVVAATDDPILPVEDVERLPPLRESPADPHPVWRSLRLLRGQTGPGWLERSIERTLSGE